MLQYAITFLIIALVAAVFGFGGLAVVSIELARMTFGVFIILFLILFFSLLAMHGWHSKNGDQASFASDLAKQLVSAILTLLVAARTAWPKNGNGGNNGTTPANGTPATPVSPKP